jgi:2-polyprenyl-3-methyl-5-hydroxy-6-metoxy-1,4-benzoquinol methylase
MNVTLNARRLELGFPACLEADFPIETKLASAAVESVLRATSSGNLEPLARRSPALKDVDWSVYLRCSIARMAHVLAGLSRRGVTGARVLDVGSYFGNVSLMLAAAGHRVHAVDSYQAYEGAFAGPQSLMRDAGVQVQDFAEVGFDLRGLDTSSFDVVVCLGVVEHVPHTPRLLLESLNRVLVPGGHLVLDTPNHAYLYNRQRLASGESVMAPIQAQYYSDIPFEGHHREYTPSEMAWILSQIGHTDIDIELFNYSVYALGVIEGRDLENFWMMVLDPAMREIIMTFSRKSAAQTCILPERPSWRDSFREAEPSWVARVPFGIQGQTREIEARAEIAARRTFDRLAHEIAARDRTIADLNVEIGELQRERDRRLGERVKRYWRRLIGGGPRH